MRLVREGNTDAIRLVREAGRALGEVLASCVNFFNPRVIVLAGGVSGAGQPFLQAVQEQVRRRGAASDLAARRLRPDQVVLAMVDDAPGARGAAVLAARLIERRESPAARKERQ